MITLKTLEQATAQEVFDQAAIHLLGQRERAVTPNDDGMCAYRTNDGLKCAVGCFIADDEYSPTFEGLAVSDIGTRFPSSYRGVRKHLTLLMHLQGVHDEDPTDDWLSSLRYVAQDHELNTNVLDSRSTDICA